MAYFFFNPKLGTANQVAILASGASDTSGSALASVGIYLVAAGSSGSQGNAFVGVAWALAAHGSSDSYGVSQVTVTGFAVKVSPRLATITDTGAFTGSGKIVRRSA